MPSEPSAEEIFEKARKAIADGMLRAFEAKSLYPDYVLATLDEADLMVVPKSAELSTANRMWEECLKVINAHVDPNWPSDYRDDIIADIRSRISGD